VTLYLVPCALVATADVVGLLDVARTWYLRPFRTVADERVVA
jgi:hypothetical protein